MLKLIKLFLYETSVSLQFSMTQDYQPAASLSRVWRKEERIKSYRFIIKMIFNRAFMELWVALNPVMKSVSREPASQNQLIRRYFESHSRYSKL